jgi:hypothetical protein
MQTIQEEQQMNHSCNHHFKQTQSTIQTEKWKGEKKHMQKFNKGQKKLDDNQEALEALKELIFTHPDVVLEDASEEELCYLSNM